jgi:hypothetical protein
MLATLTVVFLTQDQKRCEGEIRMTAGVFRGRRAKKRCWELCHSAIPVREAWRDGCLFSLFFVMGYSKLEVNSKDFKLSGKVVGGDDSKTVDEESVPGMAEAFLSFGYEGEGDLVFENDIEGALNLETVEGTTVLKGRTAYTKDTRIGTGTTLKLENDGNLLLPKLRSKRMASWMSRALREVPLSSSWTTLQMPPTPGT